MNLIELINNNPAFSFFVIWLLVWGIVSIVEAVCDAIKGCGN